MGVIWLATLAPRKQPPPILCFLDDDDTWTDPDHLGRAHAVITEAGGPVDLYMTNQAAFLHDKPLPGPIWIEDLPPIPAALGNLPDRYGTYIVTTEELLRSQGLCQRLVGFRRQT
jgi:hypothetical protein